MKQLTFLTREINYSRSTDRDSSVEKFMNKWTRNVGAPENIIVKVRQKFRNGPVFSAERKRKK